MNIEKLIEVHGFDVHGGCPGREPSIAVSASNLRAWQAALSEPVASVPQDATPCPCEWLQDEWDNSYDTSCGNKYEIIDGTPEHNGMNYCTYCGGKLEAITGDATRAETRGKHEH